jgi:hypothetical protein
MDGCVVDNGDPLLDSETAEGEGLLGSDTLWVLLMCSRDATLASGVDVVVLSAPA